jgi:predicted negative regulator of RcsB-dependent stress response
MLGASIVVAGTLSYFTAGAGAPAAATGVSTVASLVGGGGAGSYMAGLSIIGSWFGGNAMLGSAILNGIAFGLGGGGAAYASLPAIGKAGVLASVSATALDGVLIYLPPDKKELVYRIRLPVPDRIGSSNVENLVEDLNEVDADLVKLAGKIEKAKSKNETDSIKKLESELRILLATKKELEKQALERAAAALKKDTSAEDLLVLAILSKNLDHPKVFYELLRKIPAEQIMSRSYLDYLSAVTSIEGGRLGPAEDALRESWGGSPYAIEPALLLVNLLGHKGFEQNEKAILEVVGIAERRFDSDKYASSFSLLALYFRVGTMYFMAKRYADAQTYFEKAYKELPWTQKYLGSPQLKNLIRLAIANSLYGQGHKRAAEDLINEVLEDAETYAEKERIRSQFAPNVESNA